MTFVRARRSLLIHGTWNLRVTGCKRKCDGWVVEFDTALTCPECIRVAQDIDANGN